ncbi:MAG: hypothetical protein QNJ91_02375 [Gammaproteobacteria bacterium]|nr:hypothetical protein [Gammaproteobacteria bacterium]
MKTPTLPFEELIARKVVSKRFRPQPSPIDTGGTPLPFHGHCHEKAVGAMKTMRGVSRAITRLQFALLDSSCSGMAGGFGMDQKPADVGVAMAETALFAVSRRHPQARTLTDDFSCALQIREGRQHNVIHLARLLLESATGAGSRSASPRPVQETTR